MNNSYAKYFEDCGIGVVAMEGMEVSFRSIPDVPAEVIYTFIKKEVSPAYRCRRHLHPGVRPGRAWPGRGAGAGPWRSGGAADRGAPLGNPAAPACPPADQRRAMARFWKPCLRPLFRSDRHPRAAELSSFSGRMYPTFASRLLLSSFRGNLIFIGKICLHRSGAYFWYFFLMGFDDARLFVNSAVSLPNQTCFVWPLKTSR